MAVIDQPSDKIKKHICGNKDQNQDFSFLHITDVPKKSKSRHDELVSASLIIA